MTDVASGIARLLKQEGIEWVSTFPVCRVNNAFGREGIPFVMMQGGSDCAQPGVLTFLFSNDGATSSAAYQLSESSCDLPGAVRLGTIEAVYVPGSVDAQSLNIESVLGCAADAWLPLVQGQGGISLTLMPDGSSQYALQDGDAYLWLDAERESYVISSLCGQTAE